MIYQTESLTFDTNLYHLLRDDQQIEVEPQVFDLLIYLIENRDRVVNRDELLRTLWKGRVVSDSALSARLKAARKAVGDTGSAQNINWETYWHGAIEYTNDSEFEHLFDALRRAGMPDW